MKKLFTMIALITLAGCKSVEVTKEEFAADGKTVTKRTSASVISFAMATELEYVHILGLGTAKAYKTDGGSSTLEALARGASKGAVEAGLQAVTP
jgi:ribonuclease PH